MKAAATAAGAATDLHPLTAPGFERGAPAFELFPSKILPGPPPRYTAIVFGAPRGGTSSVAGAIRLLGLPMGEGLGSNHEDPDFNADAARRRGLSEAQADDERIAVIARRNEEHRRWGWKYPRAAQYLPALKKSLRNPRLIVVHRDAAAVAQRDIEAGHHPLEAMRQAGRILQRNLALVADWRAPTLMVSYEKSVAKPAALARALSVFLDLSLTGRREAAITEFLGSRDYKPLD